MENLLHLNSTNYYTFEIQKSKCANDQSETGRQLKFCVYAHPVG